MKTRYIISSAIAYLLPVSFAIIMRLNQDEAMDVGKMLLYPLIFGGGLIIVILLLNRYVCNEKIARFNLKAGRFLIDIRDGLFLLLMYVVVAVIFQFTINRWIRYEPPSPDVMDLMKELSRNPWLMILWLGPVVWIGVGVFEELSKAFFLKNLWNIWPNINVKWIVLVFTSILFGMVHMYQGTTGIISTTVLALISGTYYLKIGRFWPLVISHSLYDSAWIIFGVIMINNG